MPPKKKKQGSPPKKIFLWERVLIFSKATFDFVASRIGQVVGLISLALTIASEWLMDPNNQDAIKAAVPLWIFAAIVILAGTIRAYPRIKEVKQADNRNREKV